LLAAVLLNLPPEGNGMTHKGLFAGLAGFLAATSLMGLTSARAAEATAVATEAGPSKMRVSALFVPSPIGVLHSGPPGDVVTVGSQPSFGFATAFDFVAHRNVFVGFGAGYTFNIQARGRDGEDTATAFDLTFRAGGIVPIGRRFAAYGYLAPGYSLMRGAPGGLTPQGPIVGVHAGALFDLTPTLFLAGELGYQAGFQRATADQLDIPFDASFFQIGLGMGVRI